MITIVFSRGITRGFDFEPRGSLPFGESFSSTFSSMVDASTVRGPICGGSDHADLVARYREPPDCLFHGLFHGEKLPAGGNHPDNMNRVVEELAVAVSTIRE